MQYEKIDNHQSDRNIFCTKQRKPPFVVKWERVLNVNTKHLEYLLEIERCRSINQAAQNLFLSQSNLSALLRRTEEECSISIFRRHSHGVIPTPEGELFLKYAQNIVQEVHNIENIRHKMGNAQDLSVCCTYSSLFMESFMNLRHASLALNYADAFKETGLIQTMQDVIEKKYRLALIYCFESRAGEHMEMAERYNLDMIPLVHRLYAKAFVSEKGRYRNEKAISMDMLKNAPLVVYENFASEDWLHIFGRTSEDNVLYVFDRGGLMDSVMRGDYLAVLLEKPPREEKRLGLRALDIIGFTPKLSVYMLKQKGYQLNEREKELVRSVKNSLVQWKG